jgi:hypothetical protein
MTVATLAEVAGVDIVNDPGFGSPVIGSQTADGYMSYTADSVGTAWGGTGMTAKADAGTPGNANVTLTVNDQVVAQLVGTGSSDNALTPQSANYSSLGTPAVPWSKVVGTLIHAVVGSPLTISSNAITPTCGIHSVGTGTLKTINVPYTGFTGTIVLRPTAAFIYDATANILGTGTAVISRDMYATYDGSKWAMSY